MPRSSVAAKTTAPAAAPRQGPPRTPISEEQWNRLVEAFEKYEGVPDKFNHVAKAAGVGRTTAHRAYSDGLGQPWSKIPIRDVLIARRAQKAAVSVVLSAAKTADPSRPTDPEQAALAAALGETEFEQLRRATVAAVREEIAVVDGFRRTALRAQKSGEMLGDLLVQRAEALLKKYGAKLDESGKVVLPEISGTLPEEVKTLEGIGRLLRTLAAVGRSPIEMERLRIGDPETLRRRLDAVYGGDVGGAAPKGAAAGAEGTEEGDGAEEPSLPVEEVGDTDGWLGLRVIDGGMSTRARAQSEPAGVPDEPEDAGDDVASTEPGESLLDEDAPSEVEGGIA